MSLLREILRERKHCTSQSQKEISYIVVSISDEAALEIFGDRVYDEYSKEWLDHDDHVIIMRPITSEHATMLLPFVSVSGFQFDFNEFNYFFLTSQD